MAEPRRSRRTRASTRAAANRDNMTMTDMFQATKRRGSAAPARAGKPGATKRSRTALTDMTNRNGSAPSGSTSNAGVCGGRMPGGPTTRSRTQSQRQTAPVTAASRRAAAAAIGVQLPAAPPVPPSSSASVAGARRTGASKEESASPKRVEVDIDLTGDSSDESEGASSAGSGSTATPERVSVAGVALTDGVRDIYADKANDPNFCLEYINDVYCRTRQLEKDIVVNCRYMDDVQADVTPEMRGIMIDWLNEVATEYRLKAQTLYTTVVYIDRCLELLALPRSKLQLLGCACMLISAKMEEVETPSVDEFVFISDDTYTRAQILQMETMVLKKLDYHLAVATPWHYLERFQRAAGSNELEKMLTAYVSELTLQSYRFVKYTASKVAAACVYLARKTLMNPKVWHKDLEFYTGYKVRDIIDVVKDVHQLHVDCTDDTELVAVKEKYSTSAHRRVSTTVDPLPLDTEFDDYCDVVVG